MAASELITHIADYNIVDSNLYVTPNWNGMADRVAMSCSSGARFRALIPSEGIAADASGTIARYWTMQASNTILRYAGEMYLYARVERDGLSGRYIWSRNLYTVGGSIQGASPGTTEAQPNVLYWYILVGHITAATPLRSLTLEYGNYGTRPGQDDDPNAPSYTFTDLFRLDTDEEGNKIIKVMHAVANLVVSSITIAGRKVQGFFTSLDAPEAITAGDADGKLVTGGFLARLWTILQGQFLRKDQDDATDHTLTAAYLVTSAGGQHRTASFNSTTLRGAAFWEDSDAAGHVETDFLEVRRAAMFRTLTIAEVEHMGGEVILSAAACQIARVERVPVMNEAPSPRATFPLPGVQYAFRCYFEKRANGREVYNEWKIGDQAYCCRWALDAAGEYTHEEIDGATSYYWRAVVGTGEDGDYWYVDLSETNCGTGSGIPKTNDRIVLLGHQGNDRRRTTAQVYSTVADNAPSRINYEGITSFTLPQGIELLEHRDGKTHWRVGGSDTYIDYDGSLVIRAASVTIASEGQKEINVGETLGEKFEIHYLGTDAPLDENGKILLTIPAADVEDSAVWEADGTSNDHVDDVLLSADGVQYHYEWDEDVDGFQWRNTTDRHLLAVMNFVSGLRTSEAFAELFTEVTDPVTGELIGFAKAGTYAKVDDNGRLQTSFEVTANRMTVNTDNFRLDGNGNMECQNALIRGFIFRDDTEIRQATLSRYTLPAEDCFSGLTQYFPNAREIDFRKTGPNMVFAGDFDNNVIVFLPSFYAATRLNRDMLAVARTMIGETVTIINDSNRPVWVRYVKQTPNGSFSLDPGDGCNIAPHEYSQLVCRRSFDDNGNEAIHWVYDSTKFPAPAHLHQPTA